MSKLNIFLILLLVGMFAYMKIQDAVAFSLPEPKVTVMPTVTATPTPTPTPIGQPTNIQIPKLGVNALVEPVGIDFNGRMTMPEDWGKTAWYSGEGAFKPGENGNAVIAGHLDTIYGTLGQFYYLDQLQPGDEVLVYDSFNLQRKFVVTHKAVYDYDKAPIEEIFGAHEEKRLNLITCMGVYNTSIQNYTHRLVVYTKLAE